MAFLSTIRHGEDERALDERGRSCFPSESISINTYRGGPFLAKPSDGPEDMEQEGAAIADNFPFTCIITFRSSTTNPNDSQCPAGSSHAILRPNQPSPYDREYNLCSGKKSIQWHNENHGVRRTSALPSRSVVDTRPLEIRCVHPSWQPFEASISLGLPCVLLLLCWCSHSRMVRWLWSAYPNPIQQPPSAVEC